MDIAWLEEKAIHVKNWAEKPSGDCSFFAPDFALSAAQPWLCGPKVPFDLKKEILPRLEHRVEPSPANFAQMHEEILARIRAGEFQKVVPIVCEELEFSADLHAEMFLSANPNFPNQYRYGFEFENEGLCGVTPELLFSVRDGILTTMALAGTGPKDGPSLLDDLKERHEHEVVIENIVGELKHFGTPDVSPTEERTFGILKHLYTPIRVVLNELPDFMQLVVRLHPTAALGGWPRRPAVEWLEAQDFHVSRKRFGAPFGYVDGEEMKCVVAIRGIQWNHRRALVSTGCGVVEGSQSLKEWNELKLKRSAIYKMLGLEP